MKERIYLDSLSAYSVIIVKETIDESGYVLKTFRKGYSNNLQGRESINDEVQEPYKSAILMMWGDTPTVTEEVTQ